MGKPKGKRAHRKIDVGEDAYIEKKREDAAAGGAVDELPDDSLFFVLFGVVFSVGFAFSQWQDYQDDEDDFFDTYDSRRNERSDSRNRDL